MLVGGDPRERVRWSEEAPAISVVPWRKTQMNGRVNGIVE